MPNLTDQELLDLIKNGESYSVELKVAPPRPSEVAERLAGLANAEGGYFIVGVSDEKLQIVGVTDLKDAVDTLLRSARQVQPPIVFSPPQPEIYTINGKKLVVATVPASTGPVYQASGVFWIRTGTHSIPLNYHQVVEMGHQRGVLAWERLSAWNTTLNDLDPEKVKAHLLLRSSRPQLLGRLENMEELLLELGCATLSPTSGETIKPTNAGILFFGHNPQARIPQSEIICVLFGDALGVRRYLDRKILNGNLQELIDQAENFLQRNIEVGAKVVSWRRIDLPAYSQESLREAVVNAVIHRDYSREGETIRIFVYPNRIEIRSPGSLMPGLNIAQLQEGVASSRLRNPLLGNLLRDVPGYFERIGSGVRFMLEEAARLELPVPEFREINSEIVVTFYNATVADENGGRTTTPALVGGRTLGKNPSESVEKTANDKEEAISQEQRLTIAMQFIQQHGSISSGQFMELTGVSDRTALRDLELLVKEGSLRKVGKTRSSRYELLR